MKFIVDAQLPRRLASQLNLLGHDAVHCLDLPLGNRTPDEAIITLAIQEVRVVITKDSDFVASYWLRGVPPKLLLISTGNISNDLLAHLMDANLPAVVAALEHNSFVELNRSSLTIHA